MNTRPATREEAASGAAVHKVNNCFGRFKLLKSDGSVSCSECYALYSTAWIHKTASTNTIESIFGMPGPAAQAVLCWIPDPFGGLRHTELVTLEYATANELERLKF